MKSIIISKEIHGAQSEFQLLPLGRIDPLQREINKMMGISDEQFLKHNCKVSDSKSPLISDTQREINKMMGISDEQFLEHSCKTPVY